MESDKYLTIQAGTAPDDLLELDHRIDRAHQHNVVHIARVHPGGQLLRRSQNRREHWLMEVPEYLLRASKYWTKLQTIAMVRRTRQIGEKSSEETHFERRREEYRQSHPQPLPWKCAKEAINSGVLLKYKSSIANMKFARTQGCPSSSSKACTALTKGGRAFCITFHTVRTFTVA